MPPPLRPVPLIILLLLLSPLLAYTSRPRPHILSKRNPTYSPISLSSLSHLSTLSDLDQNLNYNDPGSLLSQILIPRAVGSKNLTKVQEIVVKKFERLNWHVERDTFTATTPLGSKTFTNLIFTHDPTASRTLILSAHLDSKYFPHPPQDQFVGATDSAVPCAILVDLAESLTPLLDSLRTRIQSSGGPGAIESGENEWIQGETLQVVLFDGEEAFVDWTEKDSIYGAKHLVEKWSTPTTTPRTPLNVVPSKPLDRISHLILLDLLGAPNPVIRNFHQSTGWLFDEFLHSEHKLGTSGLLWPGLQGETYEVKSKSNGGGGGKGKSFFLDRKGPQGWMGSIEDDHIPFLKKGVPVVHLISVPFPKVWHTIRDDASALDLDTIKAWALIVRLTVAEYLGLDPELTRAKEERGIEMEDGERIGRGKRNGDELFSTLETEGTCKTDVESR